MSADDTLNNPPAALCGDELVTPFIIGGADRPLSPAPTPAPTDDEQKKERA